MSIEKKQTTAKVSTVEAKPPLLKELFLKKQGKMTASLEEARVINHAGSKGDISEDHWIKMLNDHLPSRYRAAKAFVIDSHNQISEQIDVVIYDTQYSPLFFKNEGAKYIPAESVYAIFEIKQEINKEHIEYAGSKAKSVRRLERTSAPIYHAGGVIAKPKEPFKILAGILTYKSSWSPAFGKPFDEVVNSLDNEGELNLGCAIMDGAFCVKRPGEMKVSNKDTALIEFFLDLLAMLQVLGTVTALELDKYHEAIK